MENRPPSGRLSTAADSWWPIRISNRRLRLFRPTGRSGEYTLIARAFAKSLPQVGSALHTRMAISIVTGVGLSATRRVVGSGSDWSGGELWKSIAPVAILIKTRK